MASNFRHYLLDETWIVADEECAPVYGPWDYLFILLVLNTLNWWDTYDKFFSKIPQKLCLLLLGYSANIFCATQRQFYLVLFLTPPFHIVYSLRFAADSLANQFGVLETTRFSDKNFLHLILTIHKRYNLRSARCKTASHWQNLISLNNTTP